MSPWPPLPRLEARGVDSVDGGDVGEGDVGDVGVGGLALVWRADAHAVGLVADGAVLEEHIVRAVFHGDDVVAVEDDAVGYRDVGPCYVDAVAVDWVRIPPGLPVGVGPARCGVACANEVYGRAGELEPV